LRDKGDIYDFMHFFNHGNVKAQCSRLKAQRGPQISPLARRSLRLGEQINTD